MNTKHFKILAITLFTTFLAGCSTRPSLKSLDEAHEKFLQYCKEDGIEVVLTPLKNTLWIYVPIKEDLFKIKGTGLGVTKSSDGEKKPKINFLDTTFENSSFKISYDIMPAMNYPQSFGYEMLAEKIYSLRYRTIYNNISRTYVNIEKIPGERDFVNPSRNDKRKKLVDSYIQRVNVPEFFVIVFADTINGIESKVIFNFTDYKKQISQAMALDEYQTRTINEFAGNKVVIGDLKGEYLEPHDITWGEFLSKQISQRINFAYTKSIHPPPSKPEELILEQIAKTIKIYKFENYESVYLNNLRIENQDIISKSFFDDYDITEEKPQGKIHTIKFDNLGRIIKEEQIENITND